MNKSTIRVMYQGEPVGKPRMTRSDKWNKRPPVVKYHSFKDEFILNARLAGFKADLIPTGLDVVAFIGMPDSWSRKKKAALAGEPHMQKPDADNILKAVADSGIQRLYDLAQVNRKVLGRRQRA